jgi:nucleotide-binding universal stress UspA family protein
MKKILVGLDASPRSAEILDAAIDLARKTGAKLILLRVVTVPLEVPLLAWSVAPADLGGLLEKEARKEIEAEGARLPAGMLDHTRVRLGTPCPGSRSARPPATRTSTSSWSAHTATAPWTA